MQISEESLTEAFEEWWEKVGRSHAQGCLYPSGALTLKKLYRLIWNDSHHIILSLLEEVKK